MPFNYLILLLISSFIEYTTSFDVRLYERKNYVGKQNNIDVSGCKNLEDVQLQFYLSARKKRFTMGSGFSLIMMKKQPISAADQVSSIKTYGNCVIVFRHYDCRDPVKIIKPGSGCHSDWADADCGFDNDIRSISPCDYMHTRVLDSRVYEEDEETVSSILSCDCYTSTCYRSLEISVAKASTYSISQGASVNWGFSDVVRYELSTSFGYDWGKTLTYTSTVHCGGQPGYRSWIVARSMMNETRYEVTFDNGVSREITVKEPIAAPNGELELKHMACKTQKYKNCTG